MPATSVSIEICADTEAIFGLIHDYSRRLDWDPFLREAVLLNEATLADVGVVSRCVARKALGGIAMETEYVSFSRPAVAAVSMICGPFFLRRFAASIRQEEVDHNVVKVTYRYNFAAKPRFLAFIMEPLINLVFKHETRKRLAALKSHLE